jgi:hypothetical protein
MLSFSLTYCVKAFHAKAVLVCSINIIVPRSFSRKKNSSYDNHAQKVCFSYRPHLKLFVHLSEIAHKTFSAS